MTQNSTVLVVDDEADILEVLGQGLSQHGYGVRLAGTGQEGLKIAKEISPDLLILDVHMPGLNGFQLKKFLNRDELTSDIPTIFLSASHLTDLKVEGFHLGAEDYVTKPFNMEELMARVDAAVQRHRRSVELSITDKLTGLYNLRGYKKQIASLFNGAKRYGRDLSLAILDIDDLKIKNDTLGHPAGDFVIKKVAEIMRLVFRKPDILIRYGGDEFVVLMPESSEEQASKALQRFKEELEGKPFTMSGTDPPISITVSSGLACYDKALETEEDLFKIADQNLYQEKARKNLNDVSEPWEGETIS